MKRGAQNQVHNPFEKNKLVSTIFDDEEAELKKKVSYLEVFPKSIVNKVPSKDLGFDYSMNPYQGCAHGCSYCFARPTHEYWGYNAGLDFEQKVMVKPNAPKLLKKFFERNSYECKPIALSGNTDCYQPIERKLKITRKLLQVSLSYRNPIQIVTKNSLVERDADILEEMSKLNLIQVVISIPTINKKLRSQMEPATSTAKKRLKSIEKLSTMGIPCFVLIAPVIPYLTSHEIPKIIEKAAQHGAKGVGFSNLRLNDTVQPVFLDWLEEFYPDRKNKIINHVKQVHGGKLEDRRAGLRMRGEGEWAEQIATLFKISKNKYFKNQETPKLRTDLFQIPGTEQSQLFN